MKQQTLKDVFSLLPRKQADHAIKRILKRSKQPALSSAFEIQWAEFELSGKYLRGGISDICDLSTQIVSGSQSFAGIDLLARRARRGDVTAGHLEWQAEKDMFIWYLPYRYFDNNGKPAIRLRGMVITCGLFGEIIELFNADFGLSEMEKRILFQLVGGLHLRQAAKSDNVSYETKRAHVKFACDKLQCTGQRDLVSKIIGQLVHLMSISDSDLAHSEPCVSLVENFLFDDMQFVTRRHSNGKQLRYLIGGPRDGTPVVMVHGMMFPVVLRGVAKHLERHRIRLIVPIRSGYMESRPLTALFDNTDVIEKGLSEISLISQAEALTKVTLLGNSLGGVIALHLARKRPELFSSLVLLSTNLAQPLEQTSPIGGDFYRGMQNLKSNALLFKLANLEYRNFYSDNRTCEHILKKHFAASSLDLDVLDGVYCGDAAYEMFAATYTSSIVGIAEDFFHVFNHRETGADKLSIPVSIIHGAQDPLSTYEEVREILKNTKTGENTVIENAGHFAVASHGDDVWRGVAQACRLQ